MKYKFRSNYVPVEIAMFMENEVKNIKVIGINDDDVDDSVNVIQ